VNKLFIFCFETELSENNAPWWLGLAGRAIFAREVPLKPTAKPDFLTK